MSLSIQQFQGIKWKRLQCSIAGCWAVEGGEGLGALCSPPAPEPAQLGTSTASFSPLNRLSSSKDRGRFSSGSSRVWARLFAKHCSTSALQPQGIPKRPGGSCPLNASGLGFAFTAPPILSELSPVKAGLALLFPRRNSQAQSLLKERMSRQSDV